MTSRKVSQRQISLLIENVEKVLDIFQKYGKENSTVSYELEQILIMLKIYRNSKLREDGKVGNRYTVEILEELPPHLNYLVLNLEAAIQVGELTKKGALQLEVLIKTKLENSVAKVITLVEKEREQISLTLRK